MEKSITGLSRRNLLRNASLLGAGITLSSLVGESAYAAIENVRPDGIRITPEKALEYLKKGNGYYAKGLRVAKNYAPQKSFTDGQWPFAAILGCSDSRVQPDEVFGVAPANLFVVRNAGNVIDDDVLGSVEYAVEHLSASLVVVMGHSSCGAVKATEAVISSGKPAGGHIDALVNRIKPNIINLPKGHTVADAVLANAKAGAAAMLSESPMIEEAEKAGDVKVVYATFDLATKKVTFSE